MKRAFTRKDFFILVIIFAVFAAISLPKILGISSGSDEARDVVFSKSAQKLAAMKFMEKKVHQSVETFCYDARRSRVLDLSKRNDIAKLPDLEPYGLSTRRDFDGSRTGAIGVPSGNVIKIEMDSVGKITGMFWVRKDNLPKLEEEVPAAE